MNEKEIKELAYAIMCPHVEEPMREFCPCCLRIALDELNEWRTGKRRVFWRVKWFEVIPRCVPSNHIKYARYIQSVRPDVRKLYRVTVRPKGAKR